MLRLLLAAPILALVFASPAFAAAKAPAGNKFYQAPTSLIAGKPGTIVWSRAVKKAPVHLKQSAATTLILYRSRSVSGKAIAVSGTVDVPKGKAPKGGWKVISWAHGTTGMADICAPSRNTTSGPAFGYVDYTTPMRNSWLKNGYAVLRTDYEGLGTPGPHPYLIGNSEGRSVVDIALAARRLNASLSKHFMIAGHSQGGQASLFAAQGAKTWAPSLQLKGVLAFAPASHFYAQKSLLPLLTSPSGLSPLAAMIVASASKASSVDPSSLMSPAASALLPDLESKCSAQLAATDSFGGIAPADLLTPGADQGQLDAALNGMNPAVKLSVPAAIWQGSSDSTVFASFTAQLVEEITPAPQYVTWTGLDHSAVVTDAASQKAATVWISSKLG